MIPNIFISSTIQDLKYLRDALRDVIYDLAYHPIMSEHSEVGYLVPNTAAESCYKSIKQCQLAIIIVGHRYGKTSESGISVTHKEFRTAREHNIPLIAFVEAQVLSYKEVYQTIPDPVTWEKFPHMDNPDRTFEFIDEIMDSKSYNGLIPFSSVTEAKKSLKLQIANFVGESLLATISPMRSDIKDVLAEIKTLRHELIKEKDIDQNFLTALRFLLEDTSKDLLKLIKFISSSVEKAIPLLINAKSFEEFLSKCGYSANFQEDFDIDEASTFKPDFIRAAAFSLSGFPENEKPATGVYALYQRKKIVMNAHAKVHFEILHGSLKDMIDIRNEVNTDTVGNTESRINAS